MNKTQATSTVSLDTTSPIRERFSLSFIGVLSSYRIVTFSRVWLIRYGWDDEGPKDPYRACNALARRISTRRRASICRLIVIGRQSSPCVSQTCARQLQNQTKSNLCCALVRQRAPCGKRTGSDSSAERDCVVANAMREGATWRCIGCGGPLKSRKEGGGGKLAQYVIYSHFPCIAVCFKPARTSVL